jgi:hypothetical protein
MDSPDQRREEPLAQIEPQRDLEFAFAPWRRERIAMPPEQWQSLIAVSHGLFTLDALQLFEDLGVEKHFQAMDVGPSLGTKLRSDACRMMAIHLSLLNYNRLALSASVPAVPPELASYRHLRFEKRLSLGVARRIWDAYQTFLGRWMRGRVFLDLFTLPYKQRLEISPEQSASWSSYLSDLDVLCKSAVEDLGSENLFRLLNFWLRRTHEAGLWPDDAPVEAARRLAAECWQNDDFENNRAYTYADYCGSVLAGQMIQQSPAELLFPCESPAYAGPVFRGGRYPWVDQQVYGRMASCLNAAKDHPKGALLTQSCRDPDSIGQSDAIALLRTLRFFSGAHFMGHIGELVGLPLVIRRLQGSIPEGYSCIPGSSLRIRDNGWKQGPDALIARLVSEAGSHRLLVHGVVEIKAYYRPYRKLADQIAAHRQRLLELGCHAVAGTCRFTGQKCWLPWGDRNADPPIEISDVTIDPVCLDIVVVPTRNLRSPGGARWPGEVVEMPWLAEGFQAMAYRFCGWILENFGRVDDPDDYDLGLASWERLLTRLLSGPSLAAADSLLAKKLLAALQSKGQDADGCWSISGSQVEKTVRLADRSARPQVE